MRIIDIVMISLFIIEVVVFFTFLSVSKNRGEKTRLNIRGWKRAAVVFAIIAIQIITVKLLLFPPMKPVPTTGQYEVEYRDSFYTDYDREDPYANDGSLRELPVTFIYPSEYDTSVSSKCPLVIFSHGSTGVRDSNETLYSELASHGYVVCTIDHPYQCISTTLSNGKKVNISTDFLKELGAENPHDNKEQSVKNFQKWMGIRMSDINCVLDEIIADSNEQVKDIVTLIDTDKICVMGHSLGGSAALGVGRNREEVKACIALESAFLSDVKGVDENNHFIMETEDYPIPVLNVYSDASWTHLNEWEQYAENAKLLDIESDTIRNLYIAGVGHIGLTDLSMVTPFLTTVIDGGMRNEPQDTLKKINDVCLDFLEDNLRNLAYSQSN